jgi:SAM-dependent methyltransferase
LALDVGCGPGRLPALLEERGARAYGVDLDPQALVEPLHHRLARADGLHLPFPGGTFHLATATNLLFLLPDPPALLHEMARVLRPDGQLYLLNPSEHLTLQAASDLAAERGLQGTARESLLVWARRAEAGRRWTEAETASLLAQAGLRLEASALKMGPGFARFVRASLKTLKVGAEQHL